MVHVFIVVKIYIGLNLKLHYNEPKPKHVNLYKYYFFFLQKGNIHNTHALNPAKRGLINNVCFVLLVKNFLKSLLQYFLDIYRTCTYFDRHSPQKISQAYIRSL